jgi:hypothetical protein
MSKLLSTDVSRAFMLTQSSHEPIVKPTILRLLKNPTDDAVVRDALLACTKLPNAKITVPLTLFSQQSDATQIAAMQCASSQSFYGIDIEALEKLFTEHLSKHSFLTNTIAQSLANYRNIWSDKLIGIYINSPNTDAKTLDTLFAGLNKNQAAANVQLFIAASQSSNPTVKKAAIDNASHYMSNAQLNALLWKIFSNPEEPIAVRVSAANQLAPQRANDIIAEVNNHHGH